MMTTAEHAQIDDLVQCYSADLAIFDVFVNQLRELLEQPRLRGLYHSLRWRVKDPEHLRDKLQRKLLSAKAEGVTFDLTRQNLFERINDLAGLRLLHLHTTEFERINSVLLDVLDEDRVTVIEGPTARVWDNEYRDYFASIGVPTIDSDRMYTSVHYVVEANKRTKRTAEIQVRTLAEELWGEVDHTINYPRPSPKLACQEQIKVLARVTSSCTRLVDAIFLTHEEPPPPAP